MKKIKKDDILFYGVDCTGSDYIRFYIKEDAIKRVQKTIDDVCFGDNIWFGKSTENNPFNCEVSESQWNSDERQTEEIKKVFDSKAIDFLDEIIRNVYNPY